MVPPFLKSVLVSANGAADAVPGGREHSAALIPMMFRMVRSLRGSGFWECGRKRSNSAADVNAQLRDPRGCPVYPRRRWPKRVRADLALVEQGLAPSREKARALILAGEVLAGDRPIDKAGDLVDAGAELRLRSAPMPYVSRGGRQAGARAGHVRASTCAARSRWTSARRRAASRTACCSGARRASTASTSGRGSSTGRSRPIRACACSTA